MTGPFLLSISVFIFSFFISLFLFGSVRQIKLAICWLLGARKSEIVEVEVEAYGLYERRVGNEMSASAALCIY